MISTDQFKDLLALEEKFGKIPLGNQPQNDKPEEPKEKDATSLWLHLSEFLHYNNKQMRQFKKTIEESQSIALVDVEIERKKTLQAYIKQQSKRKKEKVLLDLEG